MSLDGQQVLVTGATGFIGGRLVETLIQQHGCRVRALVRNFSNAARLARFPVEMIGGEIHDEAAVTKAAQGCAVIIHAAMGTAKDAAARRQATVQGTETVLKAGLTAKVQRVVHISTISVYGMTPDGDLNENSPRGRLPDEYSRYKTDAETLALEYHNNKGLPVAIVQPTIVYGPFASSWTVWPLKSLRTEQVVLPEEGQGFCNAVYVDDVVDAIIRAAYVPAAVGECFLVSGAEPVTWRDFYGAYEEMLGLRSTVSMTESEFLKEIRGHPVRDFVRDFVSFVRHPKVDRRIESTFLLRVPYNTVRRLIPRGWREELKGPTEALSITKQDEVNPIKRKALPDRDRFRWLVAKTHVRIEKARQILGYAPQFDLRAGMLRTRLWAEWASILN
jgi:nucleoside-diphosphate-sugar epimerase